MITPSEEIYQKIKEIKESGKIVIASYGALSASGAYYLSLPANKIIANPATITGSIGVFTLKPSLEELAKKLDVEIETFKRGKYSDLFSILNKTEDDERKILKDAVDNMYDRFINLVAENRKLSHQQVEDIAQGKVWTGSQALKLGLIDELGGLSEAIETAKILGKLKKSRVLYLDLYEKGLFSLFY